MKSGNFFTIWLVKANYILDIINRFYSYMKDRISRILFPIDGSETSMTAAEYALSITIHYHTGPGIKRMLLGSVA